MVEAAVVTEVWNDVEVLRRLLGAYELKPLAEALFIDEFGNWRLVVVMPNVEETGTRPIYSALDAAASKEDVDYWLLERLVVLADVDSDATALTRSLTQHEVPPRKFELTLPSLPGYAGAVIGKNDRLNRFRTGRELEADIERFLAERSLPSERGARLEIGWRPDFTVALPNGEHVLLEAVVVDRRSIKTRVRDAAGLANIAGKPVILVMRPLDDGPLGLDPRYGIVPVIPVLWGTGGSDAELDAALTEVQTS